MNRFASFYALLAIMTAVFLFPQTAVATVSYSSMSATQKGSQTTCTNDTCMSSESGSKATVCINEKCTTSNNGNVDIHDGYNHVQMHNDTQDILASGSSELKVQSSTTSTPEPSTFRESTVSATPALTPDPTIMQMRQDINYTVSEQANALKEHLTHQEAAVSAFFKSQIGSIQKFFATLFK